MVNTFLVHTNFVESAKLLDQKRLPNQRREAFQILHHVQQLKAMGNFVNHPLPIDPYEWYDWIRLVIKQYRQKSCQLNGQLVLVDEWIFVTNDHIPNVKQTIKYGYIYHPAVLMWLVFEEALKEYLTAHIDVSISRGIKNNMKRYDVTNSPRPPWTLDTDFITRHRTILLHKEIDRHEKPWYQLMPIFTENSIPRLYLWPFTHSIGHSAKIQGEADMNRRYKWVGEPGFSQSPLLSSHGKYVVSLKHTKYVVSFKPKLKDAYVLTPPSHIKIDSC